MDGYVYDIFLPLLAQIFNRDMCEGFPTRLIEHTIVPILKSGEPMMLSN